MSWQNFKQQVKSRGLARTNRYRVVIPFPTTDSNGVELAELFCESVALPGINIATTPQRVFGEVREMPYEKMFDPVNMTFYIDSDMTIKTAFDRWMGLIVDPQRRTVQYYESYIRDIEIYVVNMEEQQPYKITLYEAYPKALGSIQLSSESRDIMKLGVTFNYKHWRTEATSLSAVQLLRPSSISLNPQGVSVGPLPPGYVEGSFI